MARPAIVYIHGFLSSPQSAKAAATRAYIERCGVAVECFVPPQPEYPGEALAILERQVAACLAAGHEPVGLIGSSLGGYFATILAERHDLRAVLVNPAVRPYHLVGAHLGVEQLNPYAGRRFMLEAAHADELRAMEARPLRDPERYWVLVQESDETLDYRQAVEYYRGCRLTVEPGGDHTFQGYERHLPDIMEFLQLEG